MDNLGWGMSVTAAGLGIVFGLLVVLWLLLTLALRLDHRPPAHPASPAAPGGLAGAITPVGLPGAGTETGLGAEPDAEPGARLDPRLVAAITVAIVRHTDERRRQAAPSMRSYWPGSLLFASHWVSAGRMRQGQPWRRRAR